MEPLFQSDHKVLGIPLVVEENNKVVGIAKEPRSSLKPFLHPFLKPEIQHVVKIDVRQDWGNDPSLWRSRLGMNLIPCLCDDSHLHPFADELNEALDTVEKIGQMSVEKTNEKTVEKTVG